MPKKVVLKYVEYYMDKGLRFGQIIENIKTILKQQGKEDIFYMSDRALIRSLYPEICPCSKCGKDIPVITFGREPRGAMCEEVVSIKCGNCNFGGGTFETELEARMDWIKKNEVKL